jgi:homoserine kinase type II
MTDPVPQPARPHIGPSHEDTHRERFDAPELAMVLSHYDVGVIESLRSFPRGSRRSPKVKIRSRRGEYLLKRRAVGQDDPYRVAFSHDLQLHLSSQGYPVPGLVGTRDENNSMLQFNGRMYEMFNYINGVRYQRNQRQATEVGRMLGHLHRLMWEFQPSYDAPQGGYHAAVELDAKMSLLKPAISRVEPQCTGDDLEHTVDFLRVAYYDAARRVNECGYAEMPRTYVHGDWHPGNLLFREGQIVGVLDFDSARVEPRISDIANGALQFSMSITDAEHPDDWPETLDAGAMRWLVRGYDETSGAPLNDAERAALPWLIIEDLIVEGVIPIAATGSFARLPGSSFLRMIERKVKWLRPRAQSLSAALKG